MQWLKQCVSYVQINPAGNHLLKFNNNNKIKNKDIKLRH